MSSKNANFIKQNLKAETQVIKNFRPSFINIEINI